MAAGEINAERLGLCALTVPLQNLQYLLCRYHERARAAAAVEFTGGSARVFGSARLRLNRSRRTKREPVGCSQY